MRRYGRAFAGRRKTETLGLTGDRAQFDFVLFDVTGDAYPNLRTLSAGDIQLPQTKILFVNNGLAVR